MTTIKHFVVTFFNLRLWPSDKKNIPTLTPEWLDKRFGLFEKYCYPSVKNQSTGNFIWLCLFDTDTPEKYKGYIKRYEAECPPFRAHYFTEAEAKDWSANIKKIILPYLAPEDEYIITTNLDNDDALEHHMIEKIQELVTADPVEALYSFNKGLQYFADLNIALRMVYPHNHFLTLVEKNNADFKTIESYFHGDARRYLKTIDIKKGYYWMEVVHQNNVSNDMRLTTRIKYYPIFSSLSLKEYGLDITIQGSTNVFNMLIKLPYRMICVARRKLGKKIKKKFCRKKK